MSSGWSISDSAQSHEFGNWLAFAICNANKQSKITTHKLHSTTFFSALATTTKIPNTPLPKWKRTKSEFFLIQFNYLLNF